jgi:hypothetical protein
MNRNDEAAGRLPSCRSHVSLMIRAFALTESPMYRNGGQSGVSQVTLSTVSGELRIDRLAIPPPHKVYKWEPRNANDGSIFLLRVRMDDLHLPNYSTYFTMPQQTPRLPIDAGSRIVAEKAVTGFGIQMWPWPIQRVYSSGHALPWLALWAVPHAAGWKMLHRSMRRRVWG